MIVVDTSAVLGLVDRDSAYHGALVDAFRETGAEWVLPWAILPEVDHLVAGRFGRNAARTFLSSVESGGTPVEWGSHGDLHRALELDRRHAALGLGLVDAIVMAMAERLRARAIVTLDLRDFGAVELAGLPELWPRDRTSS